MQQDDTQSEGPESAAKERSSQKEIRRTFKILREVWLNIGIKKIDTHEGVIVKVLLNSGITEMFMDKRIALKHGFRLQKLERPIAVRKIDRTNNSREAIMYQVECNVYYKGHIERMRIDICNLGKTEVILGMPWLAAHNSEINLETGEVKMMRCLSLCGRKSSKREKVKRVVTLEKEKIIQWTIDNKEDWGREEEIKENHRKIKEIVLKMFLK